MAFGDFGGDDRGYLISDCHLERNFLGGACCRVLASVPMFGRSALRLWRAIVAVLCSGAQMDAINRGGWRFSRLLPVVAAEAIDLLQRSTNFKKD